MPSLQPLWATKWRKILGVMPRFLAYFLGWGRFERPEFNSVPGQTCCFYLGREYLTRCPLFGASNLFRLAPLPATFNVVATPINWAQIGRIAEVPVAGFNIRRQGNLPYGLVRRDFIPLDLLCLGFKTPCTFFRCGLMATTKWWALSAPICL